MYVFEQIKNSNHESGLDCSFLNMEYVSEKQEGFKSIFKFSCKMCNLVTSIFSEKKSPSNYIPLNDAIVNGTIGAGIGYTQLAEFSASLDIPYMSNTTYSLYTPICFKRDVNCWKRRKREKEGNIDVDGTPMCTVVANGQWSKRSYKTKYDALSSVVSIISIIFNGYILVKLI